MPTLRTYSWTYDTASRGHDSGCASSGTVIHSALFCGDWQWAQLDVEIELKVRRCGVCQEHSKLPANANLHPWEWPGKAWHRVHIDYAGPFEGKMILVIVDAHSKYIDAHVMTSSTTAAAILRLRKTFATHAPWCQTMELHSPAMNFRTSAGAMASNTSAVRHSTQPAMGSQKGLQEQWHQTHPQCTIPPSQQRARRKGCRSNGIKHIRSAPFHPASNGLAERAAGAVASNTSAVRHSTQPATGSQKGLQQQWHQTHPQCTIPQSQQRARRKGCTNYQRRSKENQRW